MEAEHGSIIKLLDEVLKQLSLNDKNEAIKKTEAVLRVIKGHNETEEGYIYIELDKLDPKKQAELMLEEVKHAAAPNGWTCKVLRTNSIK